MSGLEAKLANAAAIDVYGKVMRSKGLTARAAWAHAEAKKIRDLVQAAIATDAAMRFAA